MDVNVSVSVLTTALDEVRAADQWKLPPVEADQTEMCVMVSVPVMVNAGEFDSAIAPDAAAENVADCRVVTTDGWRVPAEPGSPMCSWMKVPAMPVKVMPLSTFKKAFAVLTACNPAVTFGSFKVDSLWLNEPCPLEFMNARTQYVPASGTAVGLLESG
jgi:hypothetical protein